jgi:3,4-dihydroxy-2-butanone 4-phosphate synthase
MTNQHNGEGTQKAFTLLVGPVVGPAGIRARDRGITIAAIGRDGEQGGP